MSKLIGMLGAAIVACGGGGGGGGSGGVDDDQQQQQPATGEDPCRVHSLDELCASEPCPGSPDQVPRECGSLLPTERFATTCGGTVMKRNGGFSGRNWVFDENDELVGLQIWLDLPHECADGTNASAYVYGTVCETEGEGVPVCEGAP